MELWNLIFEVFGMKWVYGLRQRKEHCRVGDRVPRFLEIESGMQSLLA
jgi:hypothetical protein